MLPGLEYKNADMFSLMTLAITPFHVTTHLKTP